MMRIGIWTAMFMAVSMTLTMALPWSAEAMGREKGKHKGEKDDEGGKGKGEERDLGPWRVKVRDELRGLKLRIDGEEIPLDKEEITLRGGERRQVIELSEGGRIQHTRKILVEENLLERMRPRSWRLGISAGAGQVQDDSFKKLLLDGDFTEYALSGAWQPNAFGIEAQLNTIYASEFHDDDVRATFSSTQTRVAAIYEFAPFPNGGKSARRLHILTRAGGFLADNKATIGDDYVDLQDTSKNPGVHGGFDLMINARRFWFVLRATATYQTIKFDAFDFESKAVHTSVQIGGDLAF